MRIEPASSSRPDWPTPGAWLAGGFVAVTVAVVAGLVDRLLATTPPILPRALAMDLLLTAFVLVSHRRRAPTSNFGPANTVTLLRAGLTSVLAALIGLPWQTQALWMTALAVLTLALDGVDGWLARRIGPQTAFGARFDLEVDALLVLVLSLLIWQAGLAGAWVLLAGLWRYAFIGAARVLPWLDRPLPPSDRRRRICVLQLIGLIACIAPVFAPTVRTACAALAVLLVSASFLLDIGWLVRHRPRRSGSSL